MREDHSKSLLPLTAFFVAFFAFSVTAAAQPVDSFFDVFFDITLDQNDEYFMRGDGDGVTIDGEGPGPWYRYPSDPDPNNPSPLSGDPLSLATGQIVPPPPPPPTWWNQWWENEYCPDCPKRISIDFSLAASDVADTSDLWVTVNFTGRDYQGDVPVPGDGGINRLWVSADEDFQLSGAPQDFHFDLWLDWCPRWVSIDVQGRNIAITNGQFVHECIVPEPASLSLLGLGVAGLVLRRRLRWR